MRTMVAIVSGGLDSTVMAYQAKYQLGVNLNLLSFDYGQKHASRELAAARKVAEALGAPWQVVDLQSVQRLLSSSLTDAEKPVPHGHYEEASMRSTVVPHRNMLMLTLAAAYAEKVGAEMVGYAAHAGDHAIYPDCRPEFVIALAAAWKTSHYSAPILYAPFLSLTKSDIVLAGSILSTPVPYDKTWSCYEGGEVHCGKCGTCVERKEAFVLAGVPDPTEYAQ